MESSIGEVIGKNISTLRKQRGLTQESLAGELGVSFQAVSKWENGQSCPDISLLPVIADFFDIHIDELFGRMVTGEVHYDLVTELPWHDDDKIRMVVFMGRKLLDKEESVKEFTFKLEGEIRDVICHGNLDGDITAKGNVNCKDVEGDVNAGGMVCCGDIGGSLKSGGMVNCGCIGGRLDANGMVNCEDVGGSVSSSGDVNCGDVGGSVDAEKGVVSCGNVGGNVDAEKGAVNCANVTGNINCEIIEGRFTACGDINCTKIGGNVTLNGGTLNCENINGKINGKIR